MKKITVDEYGAKVNEIYEEKPVYATGGDGTGGKCDCIGMCRGALERGGATEVNNLRGTNAAARGTIEDLQLIGSARELKKGDVVLKTRDKDDPSMPLPDKYRKGKSAYDPKWGETNFTHIGTVTREDPLEITHMTSPTAQKDTKIGNWKYRGWLPWVSKNGGDDPGPDPGTEWARVYAENGKPVKMRSKPSTSCPLYWEVPCGAEVIVDKRGDEWTEITWAGISGYMMTRFLVFEEDPAVAFTVMITGITKEQADELCRTWGDNATLVKG
ncbi:MAG: hypothetical protein J6Q00_03650 [Verrucomicrobia bacterium]|nr:hypothetical protein [Verrucomicrobiota bacterium]